ncbi:hypothetical protein D918_05986 [Trichuris suis]|nr:hypothetical protein D918_05986 [Trichuris suis]
MQVPVYAVQRMEAFDGVEHMEFPAQHSSPPFLTTPTPSHMSSPVPTNQRQSRPKEASMNYYSEFDFEGDYRLRKSSSLGMCHYGVESYADKFSSQKGSPYATSMGYIGTTKQAIPQSSRKRTTSSISLSRNHVNNGNRRYSFLPATLQNRKVVPIGYAGMRTKKVGPCGCIYADKGYSSEQSDSLSRSGSLTPVIDEETSDLEQQVDILRDEVVSGKRKLFVAEVDKFTECLASLTRAATSLRDEFPLLENRLRRLMSAEMEKVVREERVIRDAYECNPLKHYENLLRSSAKSGTPQQTAPLLSPEELPRRTVSPKPEEDKPERSVDGHVLDSLLKELQTVAEHSKSLAEHVGQPATAEKRVGFAEQVKQFPSVEFMNEHEKSSNSLTNKSLDQRTAAAGRKEETLKDKVLNNHEESAKRSWLSMFGRSEMLKMVTAPVHFFQSHPNERKAQSYDPQEAKCTSPRGTNVNSNAPLPPPRTSSKNLIFDQESVDAAIYSTIEGKSLRHRALNEAQTGRLPHSFSSSAVPNQVRTLPIIQTSAVDDEPPRFMKSASSSESVNSQEEGDNYGSLRRTFSSNCHYAAAGK